jgi:hypothetical protein
LQERNDCTRQLSFRGRRRSRIEGWKLGEEHVEGQPELSENGGNFMDCDGSNKA